jgi:hypothetical protein
MGKLEKRLAWNRKHLATEKLVGAACSLPNGYRVAYTTKTPADSFASHLQKCLWWWGLVKENYPGAPAQKDMVLNGLVKGLSEIWPKEIMGYRGGNLMRTP